jgi:hypothetical protein
VILAEGKRVDHLVAIVSALSRKGLGALVSRPTREQLRALRAWNRSVSPDRRLRVRADGRLLRLPGPLGPRHLRGLVAVLTAGTSDVPLAEETSAILQELGIRVVRAYDVGVAGLHRLLSALDRLEPLRPELYIVFAGREGALPTVVAGLVSAPVVGVPTSIGYGRGGRGEAALSAMLQSCAPLAVVNIDASVPAALFAAQRFAERGPVPPKRRPPSRSARRSRGRRAVRSGTSSRQKGF